MTWVRVGLWILAAAAFTVWALVAFVIGWRLIWFRRKSTNESMAEVYRRYGEDYRPVGRLRWIWIVCRSIPMSFFFAAFGIVAFILHIPAAIWSLLTGKPPRLPDLLEIDNHRPN